MEDHGLARFEVLRYAPTEFAPADWTELAALDPSILEIGSHTQSHPNCDKIDSPEELRDEIAGSKSAIERHLGWSVAHFCYPAGAFNNTVIDSVRSAGFESAVTTIEGFAEPGADLFLLKRIVGDNDLLRFKAIVSGSLPWLQRSLGHWRTA
jgi:peptidoglycan/xylan/chitin deacetylase (PgdA/CDA1 family)